MGTVHAIGDPVQVQGWVLAGVDVHPASTAAEARTAWADLPRDATVVIATPDVGEVVAGLVDNDGPLLAVLPG